MKTRPAKRTTHSKYQKWDDAEREVIKLNFQKLSDTQIGRMFGVSGKAIEHQRRILGLIKTSKVA
ncbi:MAG: hypothetical protein V4714_17675 [Bacteroidota bacterium]